MSADLHARANAAIAAQAGLLKFWTSEYGRKFGAGFYGHLARDGKFAKEDLRSMLFVPENAGEARPDAKGMISVDTYLRSNEEFPRWEHRRLSRAETFTVAPDMHDFVRGLAHEDLPEEIDPEAVFALSGFLHLPAPLLVRDNQEVRYPIAAMCWDTPWVQARVAGRSYAPYLRVSTYSGPPGDDTALGRQRRDEEGQYLPFGVNLDLQLLDVNVLLLNQLETLPPYAYTSPFRYLINFLLVANEKVAAQERLHATGVTAREAARKAHLVSGVRVVRLRREAIEYEDPGHREVEWSHRWQVKTHWAWRRFGPGRLQRRKVLIRAFVKGPSDKPFIPKTPTYVLDR